MIKFILMFMGVWLVAVPIFLLFGANSRDIITIFIASVLANVILLIYTTVRKSKAVQ